jgi:hypothetical protein
MDITKTHNTEIYKVMSMLLIFIYFCAMFLMMAMLLIFIYFCVMFFGDVHVAHLYIFLCTEIYKWATWTSPKNIAQKYIKMSNMEITKKHNTEIYVAHLYIFLCYVFDDGHVTHLYIFLCYVFWWCPCCSFLYFSVLFKLKFKQWGRLIEEFEDTIRVIRIRKSKDRQPRAKRNRTKNIMYTHK